MISSRFWRLETNLSCMCALHPTPWRRFCNWRWPCGLASPVFSVCEILVLEPKKHQKTRMSQQVKSCLKPKLGYVREYRRCRIDAIEPGKPRLGDADSWMGHRDSGLEMTYNHRTTARSWRMDITKSPSRLEKWRCELQEIPSHLTCQGLTVEVFAFCS